MDKQLIEKVINNILSKQLETTKCSKTDLDGADKEAIAQFEEEKHDYIDVDDDEQRELYEKHCKEQLKHSFTQAQKEAVEYWGHSGYLKINGRIYETEHYKELIEDDLVNDEGVVELTKNLQSAIDDAPPVPHNVMTIREGHWESGHKKGDVIVQKGFASSSYTEAEDASGTDSEHNYEITYYVPSGRKGLLLDGGQFNCLPEDELLLGMGTRQYVLSQNDTYQTVEILVLPDR